MSRLTLRQGVERMIRDAVPEVTEIHDTTDHTAGTTPFFTGA
jgi:Fe/S biogenesis protein NfuA